MRAESEKPGVNPGKEGMRRVFEEVLSDEWRRHLGIEDYSWIDPSKREYDESIAQVRFGQIIRRLRSTYGDDEDAAAAVNGEMEGYWESVLRQPGDRYILSLWEGDDLRVQWLMKAYRNDGLIDNLKKELEIELVNVMDNQGGVRVLERRWQWMNTKGMLASAPLREILYLNPGADIAESIATRNEQRCVGYEHKTRWSPARAYVRSCYRLEDKRVINDHIIGEGGGEYRRLRIDFEQDSERGASARRLKVYVHPDDRAVVRDETHEWGEGLVELYLAQGVSFGATRGKMWSLVDGIVERYGPTQVAFKLSYIHGNRGFEQVELMDYIGGEDVIEHGYYMKGPKYLRKEKLDFPHLLVFESGEVREYYGLDEQEMLVGIVLEER